MEIVVLPTIKTHGWYQMAIDHSMLISTSTDGIARIRTYFWSQPTISLGYFQDYRKFISAYPHLNRLDMVRRITGGGAILHDTEITYSITIPEKVPFFSREPSYLYTKLHKAIIEAIEEILNIDGLSLRSDLDPSSYRSIKDEPEFCFARKAPTDIIFRERKVAGSAQRRTKRAILQHGSIIYSSRFLDQPSISLEEITKSPLRPAIIDRLSRKIITNIVNILGFRKKERDLNSFELSLIERYSNLYRSEEWLYNRKSKPSSIADL